MVATASHSPRWVALPAAVLLAAAAMVLPPTGRAACGLLLVLACFAWQRPPWHWASARWVAAGLLCCGLGDLLLGPQFKLGLVSIAAGQAGLALGLWPGARGPGLWRWGAAAALPAGCIAALQVPVLPPSLALIALAYCAASDAMLAMACARAARQRDADAAVVAAGALLFVGSDLLIAVHQYARPLAGADLLAPAGYYAAQLLLACHAVRRDGGAQPLRLDRRLPQA